jgi:multiple sugar transport system permease protein
MRRLGLGLGFLAPNILGFLVFTLFPLVFSFAMAFTNWDLRLHNLFRDEPLRFVGIGNFARLFSEPDFFQYFGNTLFFMLGIPFGVAGSLVAAILLSQDLGRGKRRIQGQLIATVVLIVGLAILVLLGQGATAMALLITGIGGLILFGGVLGGQTVYRTLFFFPHFTAGVATYLLWKKLYNPHTGPVNTGLRQVLSPLGGWVQRCPPEILESTAWVLTAGIALLVAVEARRLVRAWNDGEMGWISEVLGAVLICLPAVFVVRWTVNTVAGWIVAVAAVAAAVAILGVMAFGRRLFRCPADGGIGRAVIGCGTVMVLQFMLVGLGNVLAALPGMSADGLAPPEWLTQFHWAKPALMIMGLWAAIGSNNMLLYLAGLSNVPPELYEAADIDGASRLQRFWNVTWPQLAPVTFFILVMATIGGLQGGFEMARTMTQGGPAGATTTLSYYVYNEGFQTGRLGYASAVAWALFALIFAVTLFNWKFGNRYVNE